MITLEEAIKKHLDNEQQYLSPQISPAIKRHTEIHIKFFESAPRDSKLLQRRIEQKEKLKEQTNDIVKTLELYTEIEALKRLLSMVKCHEEGKPIDGLAY